MFILMLIGSMLLMDLLWWGWANQRLRHMPGARRWRVLLAIFMAAMLGGMMLMLSGRIAGHRVDELLPRLVVTGIFLWHFIILPIGLLTAVIDLLVRAAVAIQRRMSQAPLNVPAVDEPRPEPAASAPAASSMISRRQFLGTAAVAAPPLLTVLASGYSLSELDDFRIRPYNLALASLPRALDGLRIAQVTDLHVGSFSSARGLRRVVEATNRLRPDLVLLTGDLINRSLADLPAGLDVVRQMDAKYGIYMIEGNHDLMESRAGFEQTVRASGVPLLINESKMLDIRGENVQLLGLRWGAPAGFQTPGAAAGAPASRSDRSDRAIDQSMDVLLPQMRPEAFPILLAHHPHAFDRATAAGIPLTLSGHTHGGQIMATKNIGFGPWMFRYWSGLYQHGRSNLLVSNGVGNWFPLRINAPAEILDITLRQATT